MKHLGTLALATVVFAACELQPLTEPVTETAVGVGASAAIMASAEEVESYVLVLEDISTRLLPSLENQSFAVELKGHLQALSIAMSANEDAAAASALASATSLINGFRDIASQADNADLGAMALDIAAANRMIGFDQ